ncbi:uncharacterized protein LOC115090552 isoform X2 [Rhinatrema bivittatum]|uniref:uncharacterized protein LOC115090552 isoform X2 n=1 Tax=Rhinatrema bivittatum TaxID=194408 RepID=UPI001126A263|nr:uncharacterized protein LOC115090552 isoform X2 [Rhinatrema bivittatum]
MTDPAVAAYLTKVLCARGGRLPLLEIPQHLDLSPAQITALLLEEQSRFLLLEADQDGVEEALVLPLTTVQLCNRYLRDECEACDRLHLCRFFILGRCGGKANNRFHCKFSHDIHSEYNRSLLKTNQIGGLNTEELKVLLLQNDPELLPEICFKYKGSENPESCTEGENCKKLHVCRFFTRRQCRYFKCKRSHNLFDPIAVKVIQVRGLSRDVIQNIQLLCNRRHRETCEEWTKKGPRQNKEDNLNAFIPSSSCKGEVHGVEPSSNITINRPVIPDLVQRPLFATNYQISKPNVLTLVGLTQTPLYNIPQTSKPDMPASGSLVQVPLANFRRSENRQSVQTLVDLNQRTLADVRIPEPRKSDVQTPVDMNQRTLADVRIPETRKSDVQTLVDLNQRTLADVRIPETRKSDVQTPVDLNQRTLADVRIPETRKSDVQTLVDLNQRTLADVRIPETRKSDVQTPVDLNQRTLADVRIPETRKSDVQTSVDLNQRIASTAPKRMAPKCPTKPAAPEKMGNSNEICLFNLWSFCKNANKCPQMHYHLPYRWQILQGSVWNDLPRMEEIEKAYCNPNNTSSGAQNIDFEKMTCAFIPIQRLSTVSSVTKPANYQLTTEWLWYWKNEYGQWIEYGKPAGSQKMASLSSSSLENVYLADTAAIVPFQAGSQSYEINFADMVQRNVIYQTKREICRRPKFLSFDDVVRIKTRKGNDPLPTSPSQNVPPNWDKSALPELGYKAVEISSTSAEYRGIQKLFENTMSGYTIQKMKRIQNPSLWQVFQWQKDQMKKLNGGKDVNEKMLFHGTNESLLDPICRHNFDWRICGAHGTLYGKGSYFARDASYSHNYCQSGTSTRSMFVARVLVGDSVPGNASFLRPPSKTSNVNFYDSCVDKMFDPSIFVIFEKHQVYPEYVLDYVEEKKCCIS